LKAGFFVHPIHVRTCSVLVSESPQENAPHISIKLDQETICSHSDLYYYYSKGDYSC